jgi:hypothetical protein
MHARVPDLGLREEGGVVVQMGYRLQPRGLLAEPSPHARVMLGLTRSLAWLLWGRLQQRLLAK